MSPSDQHDKERLQRLLALSLLLCWLVILLSWLGLVSSA